MSQITYGNKVTLNSQPSIANINKVTADDMNEIKSAHNDTDNKVHDILSTNQCATAYLSNDITDLQNSNIPLDQITSSTNLLTLSNNGIMIGSGITRVLVSGNVFFQASNNNGYIWTKITLTRNNVTTDISTAIDDFSTNFASTSHAPRFINVQTGDIINLYKIDLNLGTIRKETNTYLTVQAIG